MLVVVAVAQKEAALLAVTVVLVAVAEVEMGQILLSLEQQTLVVVVEELALEVTAQQVVLVL
jgi:hypothetical protein